MIYQCPDHDQEFEANKEDCHWCKQITARLAESAARPKGPKRPRLAMEVYWPTNNSHEGRVIENLGHKVQFFSEKRKFRDYLIKHNIQEAG